MIGKMIADFLRGRRGATAAEFAVVLPATIFLTLGAFNITTVLFAVTGLNRAAEAAARYASVQTALNGTDPGATAVQNWATGQYWGPNISPQFTYTASGCGHTVSASGSYRLVTGFTSPTLTLSANACFP